MLAALGVLGAGAAPALASETQVTFETTAPCAVLCPYFALQSEDVDLEAACVPAPDTVPGSFDDVVIDVPTTAQFIQLLLEPTIDYDSFVCRTAPDADGGYLIEAGGNSIDCNSVGVPAISIFVPFPVGCGEFISVDARPFRGTQIIFRAFNFLDGPTASGSYRIFP